jgi:predicted RecB family endonuclease
MSTAPREWPNDQKDLRDNTAEMVKSIITELEQITMNQVNNEEDMETIAAQAIKNLYTILRSLERAGAATDPLAELQNRVDQIKGTHVALILAKKEPMLASL